MRAVCRIRMKIDARKPRTFSELMSRTKKEQSRKKWPVQKAYEGDDQLQCILCDKRFTSIRGKVEHHETVHGVAAC